MNWHRVVWPPIATAAIIAFVAGYPLVAVGILVVAGVGSVVLEFWSNRRLR